MRYAFVSLLFTLVTLASTQNTRMVLLSKITDVQYLCSDPGCTPSTTLFVGRVKDCEFACLTNINCRTMTYDHSSRQCQLFADIPSHYGTLIAQVGVLTMTSIDERRQSARRSDLASELQPSVGPWGDFHGYAYCPAHTWAYGFRLRVELSNFGIDDTALNAVRLLCRGKDCSGSDTISSYDGRWGDWGGAVYCNTTGNYFMYYAAFQIEGSQGSGDDTSANDFRSKCWNGTIGNTTSAYLQAANGAPWGGWMSGAACNQGSAICGINTKFEVYQEGGDDTAMNGAFFACCPL